MENLPNEVLLRIYKYVDIMDLISLEQVSRQLYETIRSAVWPRVFWIGWHQEHLVGQYREINKYQRLGNPNKAKELIFIADTFTQLKRVNFSYGSLLEELIINVHPEITSEDVATLLGQMQSEMLRTLLIRATYDSTFFEMPFVEFSPALRNGVEAIVGDRTTTPAILRNMELFDFPILLFVILSSDTVTDEALKVLAKFTRLWKLELDCDEITDQAVIPIIQHGTLQILSVSSRYITDKVPRLAIERCKLLRRLTIGKKYPIPNAEEILEMTHSVMDKRYGPDERPTGEHDQRILRFSANRDTFECQNLHPWVIVNRY